MYLYEISEILSCNHTLYYKIISFLTKNNIKWDYIPFTNLDKIIDLI